MAPIYKKLSLVIIRNMYLIVGLGNPDKEYAETRHNSGFLFLDFLAKEIKAADFKLEKKLLAEMSEGKLNHQKVLLAKPQTYVNQSGEAVKKIKTYFKIPLANILLVHDDLDVPFGFTKFTPGSGAGGHKGIGSVIAQLKTEKISRLKIGLANAKLKLARGQKSDQKRKALIADLVLSKFTTAEKTKLKEIFKEGFEKIQPWLK